MAHLNDFLVVFLKVSGTSDDEAKAESLDTPTKERKKLGLREKDKSVFFILFLFILSFLSVPKCKWRSLVNREKQLKS